MNLTLHIFRKDIRQFRIYLAVWFGLLCLHLGVDLGWLGQVTYTAKDGFDHAANVWTGVLPGVVWLLCVLLSTFVVLADSPARREGFLVTRPVRKSDLVLAKLLFIFVLVVAPFGLLELGHLIFAGMPGWVVMRGTFERLAMVVPVAFGFGAYAALWPDVARWARSVGIIFACYIVIGLTLTVLTLVFEFDSLPASSSAPPMVNLAILAALMVVLAGWHSRAHRSVFARWGGLAVVTALMIFPTTFWPWKMFTLQPADQATAETMVNQAGFNVTPLNFGLSKTDDPRHPKSQFSAFIMPDDKILPDGCTLEWNAKRAKLAADDGTVMAGGRVGEHSIFNAYYWAPSIRYSDYAAFAPAFPSDVMFRTDTYRDSDNDNPVILLSSYDLPTTKEGLETPMTFQASLDGEVFKWSQIADLPLQPGAISTDEFGSWKFIAVAALPIGMEGSRIFLQRRQIELGTASDSRCSSQESGPVSRMAFMVYDPVTHVVRMPEDLNPADTSRGSDTALPQYYHVLTFDNQRPFSADEIARDRLIIYQKTWLGTVPKEWQPPTFTISDKLLPVNPGSGRNNDPMPNAEFERRIAALKVPELSASRSDISRFLLDYLRLVDAHQRVLGANDPQIHPLANLVPSQLDLLIDGLPAMDYPAKETVLNAISLGATDAQKPAIIAALRRDPELASVLFDRGWVEDARAEILQLAQYPHSLPESALQAIAWFQDTNTYPRLLEEFERNNNTSLFDTLRTIPALEPALEKIIESHWRRDSLIFKQQNSWSMFGPSFQLAARLGDTSTLQRAYLLLPDTDGDQGNLSYYLTEAVQNAVWPSGVKRSGLYDSHVIIPWLRQHRPEDFVFNPGLHQFVLKSIYTGDTAANSHP